MQFKEMIDRTGLKITGICKGVNEFISKEQKAYYSVDVEIKGTKMPVNVKLPADFNRTVLKVYELVELSCIIMPSFDKKGIQLVALKA